MVEQKVVDDNETCKWMVGLLMVVAGRRLVCMQQLKATGGGERSIGEGQAEEEGKRKRKKSGAIVGLLVGRGATGIQRSCQLELRSPRLWEEKTESGGWAKGKKEEKREKGEKRKKKEREERK